MGSLGCRRNGFPLSVYDLFPCTRLPSRPRYPFPALLPGVIRAFGPEVCVLATVGPASVFAYSYIYNADVVRADVAKGWAGWDVSADALR